MRQIHPRIGRLLRQRFGAGVPAGAPPVPPTPTLVQDGIIYIQLGYLARVRVYARDEDGVDRKSEAGAFASSDDGIFRVVSVESVADPDTSINHWEVVLSAVSVGTATLAEQVDAQVFNTPYNQSDVPVTDTLTVVVHQVATELVLYYTEEGATGEIEAVFPPADPRFFLLQFPINKNATLRVEGRNGKSVVPLSSVVFDDSGSSQFHFVATADPNTVTLVTDVIGFADPGIVITADGDPSPSAATLTLIGPVDVVAPPIPTNLVEFYSTEPR